MCTKCTEKCKSRRNQGFTLLEMLVVIMIMGFLLAMIAPKLLGVFQDAEDTICDSNIKESKKYVSAFETQYSKLPDKMMVPAYYDDTAGAWHGPTEENVIADGNEVFTSAILERIRLMPHVLNVDEVDEIVNDLGIREVVVLNNSDDADGPAGLWGGAPANDASQFCLIDLTAAPAGMTWPMIGGGDNVGDGTGWANHADWNAVGEDIADPKWAYRLILGIGPDSELMHRIIAAEGQCPSFERAAADDTMWGWYVVVLPRLQETVDSFSGSGVHEDITCWADSSDATSQRKRFDLTYVDGEYKRAAFDIFCPEGHRYPEVVEAWGIETIH